MQTGQTAGGQNAFQVLRPSNFRDLSVPILNFSFLRVATLHFLVWENLDFALALHSTVALSASSSKSGSDMAFRNNVTENIGSVQNVPTLADPEISETTTVVRGRSCDESRALGPRLRGLHRRGRKSLPTTPVPSEVDRNLQCDGEDCWSIQKTTFVHFRGHHVERVPSSWQNSWHFVRPASQGFKPSALRVGARRGKIRFRRSLIPAV